MLYIRELWNCKTNYFCNKLSSTLSKNVFLPKAILAGIIAKCNHLTKAAIKMNGKNLILVKPAAIVKTLNGGKGKILAGSKTNKPHS